VADTTVPFFNEKDKEEEETQESSLKEKMDFVLSRAKENRTDGSTRELATYNEEQMDYILSTGRNVRTAISRLKDISGATPDFPPTSFLGGAVRGATAGIVGEEPRGGWGIAGEATGTLASIVGMTIAFKRAMPGGVGRLANIAKEVTAGLAADTAYMAASPEDEDALTYGVMVGANIAFPIIGELISAGRHIPFKLEDGRVVKTSIEGAGRTEAKSATEDFLETANLKVVSDEETTASGFIDPPEFNPGEYTKQGINFKTQAEVDIANTVQQTRRVSNRYTKLHEEYENELGEILNVSDKKLYQANRQAERDAIQEFLDGRTITDEQELVLRESWSKLGKEREYLNEYNKAYIGERLTKGTNKFNPKQWQKQVDELERKLETIRENTELGLPAHAGRASREKVLTQLDKSSVAHLKTLENDSIIRTGIDDIKKTLQRLTEDPAKAAISMGYTKTRLFQEEFPQALGFLSRVEDPLLRREAAFEVYEQLTKQQDKIDRTVRQSVAIALKADPQAKAEAELIERTLSSGQKLNTDDLTALRPKLARYITNRMSDEIVLPENNALLQQQLKEMDAKLAGAKPEEIPALRQERKAMKDQAVKELLSDPVALRETVQRIGDKQLGDATDLFFAAAGDRTAAASLLARRNMGAVDTQARVAARNLKNNTRPNASGGEPPYRPNDEYGHGSPDEILAHTEDDLNPIRRLLGTLEVSVEVSLKKAKSVVGREFFNDTRGWLGRITTARNDFLEELKNWTTFRLNPFYDYVEGLGKDTEKQVWNLIDSVSTTSNRMIDEGYALHNIEAAIKEMVSTQSNPKIREAYRQFRQITDELYDNLNVTIRNHNDLVEQGLRRGKVIDQLAYRPGYVPFFYEGGYQLRIVGNNGNVFTHFVDDRHAAVELLTDLYKGGQVQGRVVLEPRFADDVIDMANFTVPGQSLDDVFGISADRVQTLFDSKKLNADTLHDAFWGNRLRRTLSLDEQRLQTKQAVEVASRLAYKYKHYFPVAQEGQSLVRTAKDLSLHNYADAIKTYTDDLLGRSRDTEKIVEKHIKSFLDLITSTIPASRSVLSAMGVTPNGRIVRGMTSGLTFLGRLSTLGFNPAAAMVQWLIMPTNVATVIGFRNGFAGLRELSRVKNTDEFLRLTRKAGLHINPANIGMAERLELPRSLSTRAARMRQFVDYISMYMFNGAENTIRSATLLGARRFGKQLARKLSNGKEVTTWQEHMLDDIASTLGKRVDDADVLDEFSVKMMRRTNFDFDITGLSELARNPLARPFMQFKTYFFKEYEFLFGGGLPLTNRERFIALGMFSTIGGLFAIPFADELDQFSTAIFGFSPKMWVHAHMPEIFSAGVLSYAGVDFSSKAQIGSLTRAFSPDGMWGVFPSKVMQQYKSYMGGNAGALDSILGLSTAVRAATQGFELASTGRISDKYGQTVATLDQTGPLGPLQVAMGLPPKSMTQAQTISTAAYRLEKKQKSRDAAAIRAYMDAFDAKDTAEANRIKREAELSDEQIRAAKQKRKESRLEGLKRRTSKKVLEQIGPNVDKLQR